MKEFDVALGTEVFDPRESEPVRRRSIGDRAADAPDPHDTRIVQFHGPLTGADTDRLRAEYGLALTAYLPNLAYVERVDAATRRRLQRDPSVRAVAPYRPEYKLDALLATRLAGGELGDDQVVASLFDGGSIPLVTDALTAAGASDVTHVDNRAHGGLARVYFRGADPEVVRQAAAVPDIRYLELAGEGKADDVPAAAMIQSGDTSNAVVWDRGIHGEGQIVGQLEFETADIRHCFFADVPNTPGPAHRKVVEVRNAGIGDHATFAAGCVVGDERGNSGANAHRGSAWAARLAISQLTSNDASDILGELIGNANAGAFVHTNSWHLPTDPPALPAPYNPPATDTDIFCYFNEDHVVLGSSGNTGEQQGAPGSAKNALCVSAASSDGTSVGDGNPGPTADGRRKPDIVAAGCAIHSAVGTACATTDGGCATSWATPHAAGAAALVRQYFTEGWYPTGSKVAAHGFTPSGALIRAVLVSSAVNMSGVSGYPNDTEGWGLIQIDRALTFSDNGRNLVPRDIRNRFGLRTGEEWTQAYTVSAAGGSQQLKVVLAYTDPAGTTGATTANLVNDLDLIVTDPNGVRYVGNDFDTSAGFSRPNSTNPGDSFNTIEVVLVAAPVAGTWEIKVRATNVTVDRQGFALAITSTAPPPGGGCFVATAVYEDPWHRDVVALRAWRDGTLAAGGLRGAAMGALVAVYGAVGPVAARATARAPWVRDRLRRRVFPVLAARLGPGPGRPGGTP
jgi:hypothetical protein